MTPSPNPITASLERLQRLKGCSLIDAIRALVEAVIIDVNPNPYHHSVRVWYQYGLENDSVHFVFHNGAMNQDVIKNSVTLLDNDTGDQKLEAIAHWIATDVWGPYDEFPYAALPKLERIALQKL